MKSVDVRGRLVEALWLDLVGPDNGHAFAKELLPEPPTKWYLTGFLVPCDAPTGQTVDETAADEIDAAVDARATDDGAPPDRAAARRTLLPSSMGLSVMTGPDVKRLDVRVEWGDYVYEGPAGEAEPPAGEVDVQAREATAAYQTAGDVSVPGTRCDPAVGGLPQPVPVAPDPAVGGLGQPVPGVPAPAVGGLPQRVPGATGEGKATGAARKGWRRVPREARLVVELPRPGQQPRRQPVPGSGGLQVVATARESAGSVAPGPRVVSVFLVNHRPPDEQNPYQAFAFQARLALGCEAGFVARPDPRQWEGGDEWDQRVADLQYRDVFEFAVGHGVSAEAAAGADGVCREARTTWLPWAEVERVAPARIEGVELGMEALGRLGSGGEAWERLSGLVAQYRQWIARQGEALAGLSAARAETARDMLVEAECAASRMEAGIRLLSDKDALEAFCLACRAVARSARQRMGRMQDKKPEDVRPPAWYPFQLAYLLMTLPGVADPAHADRGVVDLLFFPTGGGKTEAYLGLSAFALALRRLKSRGPDGKPSIRGAGVSVLMRYTLRLLTLDQLGRAAGLICALELEREQAPERLGTWPFEIGLWVGQAATPNRMGSRGEKDPDGLTAYTKTRRFKQDPAHRPSPIPLEECPWCGEKFTADSFRLAPSESRPTDLRVHCASHTCAFSRDRALPIVAVDEPIYRRLPCFLIATVDKFAGLPWTGRAGALFGRVERHNQDGFFGACDPGAGAPIPGGSLPGPDLIIQDELHLISGPLGTVAGLYETAIDALASRETDGESVRPKIIASTATARRAESQIRALFGRPRVSVFPPQGPDRRDSFFARTHSAGESPARLYMGVAAQGRSLKVVMLRSALALLSAGQAAWEDAGGAKAKTNPADPYMTLVGYFNSLRELGGSRRIVEDEVTTRLAEYGARRRLEPEDRVFRGRGIKYEPLELTSRVSTNDVAAAKRRLAQGFGEKDRVDVALATNMISVGIDILRLGLMMALGQPKTCAEYIQATSRVGRDPERPGLIVTLLNIHKPRDRSHYERFGAFHASFYRGVEATSVTPFSPRALDRALAAALVALCRHGGGMAPPRSAQDILKLRGALDPMARRMAERARDHRSDMSGEEQQALHDRVLHRCESLLDDWHTIARKAQQEGSAIQYQREDASPPRRLLRDFLDPELPDLHPVERRFRAGRSMRDVEPSVDLFVKNLNDWDDHK